MPFSEDFKLPDLDQSLKPVPETKANDEAFYAAGSYSQSPVQDYQSMYQELTQQGYSDTLNAAKLKWTQEQSDTNKEAVLGIINDPSIEKETKINILQQYSSSGFISQQLKDKYIQRVGATVVGDTHLDQEAQDANITTLPKKLEAVQTNKANKDQESLVNGVFDATSKGIEGLASGSIIRKKDGSIDWTATYHPKQLSKDVGGGLLSMANLITSLPQFFNSKAAMLGADFYDLVTKHTADWEQNIALGEKISTQGINSLTDWRLEGLAKKIGVEREYQNAIINKVLTKAGEGIDWLDKQAVDKGLAKPGAVKTAADVLMIFGPPAFGMAKKKISRAIDEGTSDVFATPTIDFRPDSPIDNTIQANPAVGAQLANAALQDPTGEAANAMGTDNGTIIHKTVLPTNIIESQDVRNNPDLHQEIIKTTKELEQTLDETRFDPNVVDRKTRQAELDAVNKIVNELDSPTYQQANSKVDVTDTSFNATLVFGRDSNYLINSRTAAINAFERLKEHIDTLDPALVETSDLKIIDTVTGKRHTPESIMADRDLASLTDLDYRQFSIEWKIKRDYSLTDFVFNGPKAKPLVFRYGLKWDASKAVNSPVMKWITAWGRFDPWIEQGLTRAFERSSFLSSKTLDIIRRKINDGKLNHEFSDLVYMMESEGKDFYTKQELASIYTALKVKDIDLLFEKQAYWRTVNNFNMALTDRARRAELHKNGFNKGIYRGNDYLGAVKEDFPLVTEGVDAPRMVWDYSLNQGVRFELDRSQAASNRTGIWDNNGKQLVRLEKNISDPNGKIYEYALVGENTKLDTLPLKVVKRIRGYSPILYKEHFFVDAVPKQVNVNGFDIQGIANTKKLETYTRTIAAAATKYQAEALVTEFERRMPDHNIVMRKARENDLQDRVNLHEVHGDAVRNAMVRGERLPSLNGPARIEDALTSLVKTSRSLAQLDAFRQYKEVFEQAFMSKYKDFLPYDSEGRQYFPETMSDIKDTGRLADRKAFEAAQAEFEYYSSILSMTDGVDIVPNILHKVADILEDYKVPASFIREQKGPLKFVDPKIGQKAASLFNITWNFLKQWPTQLQPVYEVFVGVPESGPKSLAISLAMRQALLSEAKVLKPLKGYPAYVAKKTVAPLISAADFDFTLDAMKKSGLFQTVDLNLMVNELMRDATKPFKQTIGEKVLHYSAAPFKGAANIVRSVGFDAAELTNRMFMYIHAKELWIKNNPGADWKTPEALEKIAYDAWQLSGGMSKPGAFPYQKGMLSMFFQFTAITQKNLMNILQDGGTAHSIGQQRRIAAARLLLYGTTFGVIGGKYIMGFFDDTKNPEIRKYAKELNKGLADRIGNTFLKIVAGDTIDPQVNFSHDLNPYGESSLGVPYIDVMSEAFKIYNGEPSGARFPALQALGKVGDFIDKMSFWFKTKDVDVPGRDYKSQLANAMAFLSGFNNYNKYEYIKSQHDKITSSGQPLGLNLTEAEALGQLFGFQTQKEIDLWKGVSVERDRKAMIEDMAKDVHKQIIAIVNDPKVRNNPQEELIKIRLLQDFIATLKGGDKWKDGAVDEMIDRVVELDRQAGKETAKENLHSYIIKSIQGESDKNLRILENLDIDDPNAPDYNLLHFIKGKGNP